MKLLTFGQVIDELQVGEVAFDINSDEELIAIVNENGRFAFFDKNGNKFTSIEVVSSEHGYEEGKSGYIIVDSGVINSVYSSLICKEGN